MKVYWSSAKDRLVQKELDGFTISFDTLSCSIHLLSEHHLIILEQLSSNSASVVPFDDLVNRVCVANDIKEDADIRETLKAVLELLEREALADSREAA